MENVIITWVFTVKKKKKNSINLNKLYFFILYLGNDFMVFYDNRRVYGPIYQVLTI